MRITAKASTVPGQFGNQLRAWRRHNNLKQAALAEMMGVSQPAVARWEQGLDMPSAARLKRLQALMAGSMGDELALERLFIGRQQAIRAMFDVDGVRMVATSAGFRGLWPDFSVFTEQPMIEHLVGEFHHLIHDRDLGLQLRDGSLGLISGISDRHTDFQVDLAIRHQWHVCFRRYGPRILADVVYEACDPGLALGITDIVHLDPEGETWISSAR